MGHHVGVKTTEPAEALARRGVVIADAEDGRRAKPVVRHDRGCREDAGDQARLLRPYASQGKRRQREVAAGRW
jgi:hypothetical protein